MIDTINEHTGLKRALNLAHFLGDSAWIVSLEKKLEVNRRQHRSKLKELRAKGYNT